MAEQATNLKPVQAIKPARSSRRVSWTRLKRSPVGLVGAVIVLLVVFIAIFAPLLAPHDPAKIGMGTRLIPPVWSVGGNWSYPLGTDQLGRDLLSRVIYGSRISVLVGVTSVVLSGAIGVVIGIVGGYYGGKIDIFLSRLVDTFLALPFIVFALAIIAVLGAGLLNLIIVLGFTGWVTYARVIRAEVLSAKEAEYVLAARVSGQREWLIAVCHIMPNIAAPMIVLSTLSVGTAIIAESSLSFLGLGVQPPTITWGAMLADGREHIATSWWLATIPGIAITLTVLGIIFLGDWLRDVLDPRLGD